MKLTRPFFVLFFPLFFVFHGFVEHFFFVSVKSAILLAGVYLMVAIVLTAFLYLISRSIHVAAITAAILLLFEFFFGHLHDLLKESRLFLAKYSLLLPLLALLALAAFIGLKKARDLSRLTIYLNLLFLVLIGIDAVSLVLRALKDESGNRTELPLGSRCEDCPRPDFYVITLDGYAGGAQLRDQFAFDNGEFFRELKARGFHVVPKSESNYDSSPSSMASTFDMEYLEVEERDNMRRRGHRDAFRRINANKLMRFLEVHGYRVFNHSVFRVRGQAAPIGESFVPANARMITDRTLSTRFRKDVLINLATRLKWRRCLERSMFATHRGNRELYERTLGTARSRGEPPKFVYTHLMMPHHPYYYNEHGQMFSYDELTRTALGDKERYLSYLKFTNRHVLSLTDSIFRHSPNPPIIVILSDHGFRYFPVDYRRYAFSNLLAVHLPSRNYRQFPDSMSNVNLFRAVLNSSFRQQLPMLGDSTFVVKF